MHSWNIFLVNMCHRYRLSYKFWLPIWKRITTPGALRWGTLKSSFYHWWWGKKQFVSLLFSNHFYYETNRIWLFSSCLSQCGDVYHHWQAAVHGVAKSQTRLRDWNELMYFIITFVLATTLIFLRSDGAECQ